MDFDDDNLKGEDSCYSLIRSCWTEKVLMMFIFIVEREVSSVHKDSKLLRRSARTSDNTFPVFVVDVNHHSCKRTELSA